MSEPPTFDDMIRAKANRRRPPEPQAEPTPDHGKPEGDADAGKGELPPKQAPTFDDMLRAARWGR